MKDSNLALEYTTLSKVGDGRRILSIYPARDAGLFSEFAVLLWDLIECRKRGLVVDEISAGYGFEHFRDYNSQNPILELLEKPTSSIKFFDLD